jgi:hypothetical protein
MKIILSFILALTTMYGWCQDVPTPRNSASIVYNPDLKQIMMYGGSTHSRSSVMFRDSMVWLWNGKQWKKHTTAPSLRTDVVLAYDNNTNKLLLYGGGFYYSREKRTAYNDTWEFDGSVWQKKSNQSLPEKIHHTAAVFDPVRKAIVLFGGFSTGENKVLNETWLYGQGDWKKLPTKTFPPARNLHAMFYDPKNNGVVIIGGDQLSPDGLRDMWILKNDAWMLMSDKIPFTLVNTFGATAIAETGDYFCFASSYHENKSETWIWKSKSKKWEQIETTQPSPRNSASIAYDGSRNCIVLFGGEVGIESVNEIWEFSFKQNQWQQVKQ